MVKVKVGGIYVAATKCSGLQSSGNSYLRQGTKYQFKITHINMNGFEHLGGYCSVQVKGPRAKGWINAGVVYGHELKGSSNTKDELLKEIEEVKKEIKEKEKEIEEINAKISFIEEAGIAEYDEDMYKVFVALTAIENKKLSKLEKADLIGKLINS